MQPRHKIDVGQKTSGMHMSALNKEQVLSVRHWTDRCSASPPPAIRGSGSRAAQFAMIGLEVDGRPLLRAYSMASAHYEEDLEFFSIKVPDGPLTSRLQQHPRGRRRAGRPQGHRHADHRQSAAGLHLYLLGDRHRAGALSQPDQGSRRSTSATKSIVLVHGCRQVSELAYGEMIVESCRSDELLGEMLQASSSIIRP